MKHEISQMLRVTEAVFSHDGIFCTLDRIALIYATERERESEGASISCLIFECDMDLTHSRFWDMWVTSQSWY